VTGQLRRLTTILGVALFGSIAASILAESRQDTASATEQQAAAVISADRASIRALRGATDQTVAATLRLRGSYAVTLRRTQRQVAAWDRTLAVAQRNDVRVVSGPVVTRYVTTASSAAPTTHTS
jgi:hypothetical protein